MKDKISFTGKIQTFLHFLLLGEFFIFLLAFLSELSSYKKALNTFQITFFIYVAFAIFFHRLKRESIIKFINTYRDLLVLLFILFLLMIISCLFNNSFKVSPVAIYKRYVLTLFILLFLYKERIFIKFKIYILYFLYMSLAIVLFSGLSQLFLDITYIGGIKGSLQEGLVGLTWNRNIYGYCAAMGLILNYLFLINYNGKNKIVIFIGYFLFLLFMIGLIFSYSRASWIFAFAFILSYLLFSFKNLHKKEILPVVFLIACFICILFYFNSIADRLNSLLGGDSSGRFDLWMYAIDKITHQPFFGYGIGNFYFEGLGGQNFPHNSILEILYSLGIVGFICSVCILTLVMKEILRSNYKKEYLAIFIGLFCISMFDHRLTTSPFLTILIIFSFYIFSNRIDKLNRLD